MSAEELESAPSRALWGLQLSAGTVLATTVFGLSLSLISMTALSPDDYRGFENLQPVFELTPWAYMVTGLAAAVGWWLAGGLPRQGVLFRIVGAATGLQAVAHLLTQLATRRGWIEDIGGFYEWYQWVGTPLWLLSLLGAGVALVIAGRHARGRAALMGVALAVAVARVLMQMFWTESLRYFYEHPWQKLGLDTAEMVLWATAVVLMTGAIGRRYDAGGLGSFARAAEGLARYRTAISLRIILAVSVIALSFMAVSARSMGLLQLVLSGSVVVGVGIAVHAARGLAGFARQPIVTGGAHWAIAAAILSLLAVLFSGVGLLDLPDFFKGGSRFRDAAEGLQALSNFGNTVGFAGVFFILLSIVKVAGHLEERLLAARARSLMWLIGLAAGSVIFLQQFGGLGLIKSAGALIGIGLVVLVVAIVALVRYLGLLGDLVTKLEIDHGVEPPRATATMLDD